MPFARRWALVSFAIVVSGCAMIGRGTYKLVEPGVRPIDGIYTVEPRLAWSALGGGKVETWTIDGVSLERLRFFKSIGEGESMLTGGANDDRRARFRASMTPTEITEFVTDSLFGSRFPPKNVRPARFGGAQGFRLEVSYSTRDGVKRDALVAGAVLQHRLQVIVYDGTSLYHFDKYRDEAEHIVGSIALIHS